MSYIHMYLYIMLYTHMLKYLFIMIHCSFFFRYLLTYAKYQSATTSSSSVTTSLHQQLIRFALYNCVRIFGQQALWKFSHNYIRIYSLFSPIICVRIKYILYIPFSHTICNAYNNAYPSPPPPKKQLSHMCEKMVYSRLS